MSLMTREPNPTCFGAATGGPPNSRHFQCRSLRPSRWTTDQPMSTPPPAPWQRTVSHRVRGQFIDRKRERQRLPGAKIDARSFDPHGWAGHDVRPQRRFDDGPDAGVPPIGVCQQIVHAIERDQPLIEDVKRLRCVSALRFALRDRDHIGNPYALPDAGSSVRMCRSAAWIQRRCPLISTRNATACRRRIIGEHAASADCLSRCWPDRENWRPCRRSPISRRRRVLLPCPSQKSGHGQPLNLLKSSTSMTRLPPSFMNCRRPYRPRILMRRRRRPGFRAAVGFFDHHRAGS